MVATSEISHTKNAAQYNVVRRREKIYLSFFRVCGVFTHRIKLIEGDVCFGWRNIPAKVLHSLFDANNKINPAENYPACISVRMNQPRNSRNQ